MVFVVVEPDVMGVSAACTVMGWSEVWKKYLFY